MYDPNSGEPAEFTEIKAKVRNAPGEEMNDGSIELVVKYRLAIDDPFKNYPEDYPFQAEPEFSYIVVPEKNGIRSIPKDSPVELTFDLSEDPIPLYAIDVYLQVVYKGKVGNEDGAVVVGFKDISEPTPIDLFNDMDRTCLNGSFYVAGSTEAIDQVDTDKNGIANEWDVYAHDMMDIYIRFSPAENPQKASPTEYQFHVPYLGAGKFLRTVYILTDYNFKYNFYSTWVKKDPKDPWQHVPWTSELFPGTAVKNQTEYVKDPVLCGGQHYCDVTYYPIFHHYRGIEMWWGAGIIFVNLAYPPDSECSCYEGMIKECPVK